MSSGSRHRIVVLALPEVVAFDLAIPAQVFGHRSEADRYELRVCAWRPGPVATTTGFELVASHGLDAMARADTVIVPGFETGGQPVDPDALTALREAHERGARIVSICTGAFALGQAGLLDGRPATTHWADAARLAKNHPGTQVDARVLWVDGGDGVFTSAGVAAGIDLSLHLYALDHGASAAATVARRMVVSPVRQGGQAQYVEHPVASGGAAAAGVGATRDWMLARLGEPLTLKAMAVHAGYSERSFIRHFRAETGAPPLRWLHQQRVQAARRLLESTDSDLEAIASATGFGTAATLRLHFGRALKTTPSAYRRTWRSTPTMAPVQDDARHGLRRGSRQSHP